MIQNLKPRHHSSKRLYILHKLPTPYNDALFRALHADTAIELQVFHLWKGSKRRPWQSVLGVGYPNYYMQPKLGIDWHTLRLAWMDRDSLFMIGDWAHLPVIALLLVRIFRNAPVVLWVDTPQEHLNRPWWKRYPRKVFLRWLLSQVDAIFASGKPARRTLVKMGASPQKILDFQFTVDLEHPRIVIQNRDLQYKRNALRESVQCMDNGIVFGMSGTIDLAKKAQDIGLKAFAECNQQTDIPIGLLIAGSGAELSFLQYLAENLGIAKQVNFLGWQEPDEMDIFYASIDVLLHPANYDPFPLVVVEAMNWGKPVIGTITSGTVEEKVQNGVNGFIVQPGDSKAITEAMLHLIGSPELLIGMGQAARKTADEWPLSRQVKIIKDYLTNKL